MVPYENVYNDILGRSCITTLDTEASKVHLKTKYHNYLSQPLFVKFDLHGAPLIHEATMKNFVASVVSPEEKSNKFDEVTNTYTCPYSFCMFKFWEIHHKYIFSQTNFS